MSSADLDDEFLQRAWRILRQPHWPATLEETLQDAIRAQLVHMFARHLLRSAKKVCALPQRAVQAHTPVAPVAPVAPAAAHRKASQLPPGCIDRKRAAAGDLFD